VKTKPTHVNIIQGSLNLDQLRDGGQKDGHVVEEHGRWRVVYQESIQE